MADRFPSYLAFLSEFVPPFYNYYPTNVPHICLSIYACKHKNPNSSAFVVVDATPNEKHILPTKKTLIDTRKKLKF